MPLGSFLMPSTQKLLFRNHKFSAWPFVTLFMHFSCFCNIFPSYISVANSGSNTECNMRYTYTVCHYIALTSIRFCVPNTTPYILTTCSLSMECMMVASFRKSDMPLCILSLLKHFTATWTWTQQQQYGVIRHGQNVGRTPHSIQY